MPTARLTDVDLPLPPMELRLMRDDDDRFVSMAVQAANLMFRLGLRAQDSLLDVGCSVGRLPIGLLTGTDFAGRYVGFDVMRKQVEWAAKSLEPVAHNTRFHYVDVRNARYNPKGTVLPEKLKFPAGDNQFDMAGLFSIFTHFYGDDILRYLHELHRVLKPGGKIVATWFLFDDARLDAAVNSPAYPMTHRLDDVTIYNDPDDPLRAIAFDENYIRGLVREAGLEIVGIEYGKWAGGPGPEFQDVVLLAKPGLPRAVRTKAAVRHRFGPLLRKAERFVERQRTRRK